MLFTDFKFIKCLGFFIMLIGLGQSYATNYYVSKDGDDSNLGTENAPFLTISKASSVLVAGDTCFIKEGVYREVLSPINAGQENSPIVFANFQNDSVLISATEKVVSWEFYKNNIYKAKFHMDLGRQNMVFSNGEPMDWARWPNNTDNDPYTVQGVKVQCGSSSTIESSEIPNLNLVGGYVWYLGAHSGTSWTREITATQSGKITFTGVDITKWPFNPHNPTVWRNGNYGQFYVFGAMDVLDYEREWYYNASKDSVFFQAPGNVDPNTLDVEIGKRARTMNITKDYIHVDGLNAFGGKIEITGENCVVRNGTFKNCLHILDELDNTDAQVSEGSVHVRAANTIIENNSIDGGSLNGVFVQGWNGVTNVTIKNNLIRNFNTVGIHASPIRSGATNVVMTSNTLIGTGRDGIYCGGTDCEIAYNDVSNCMRINNDGGVFYTVGNANDKNNTIHHNWFHDSFGPEYADGRAAGIYLDNNSKGYSVHHNVVWNITWSAIQINWDNWNIDIFNNSIYNVDVAMGRWENGYTIDDLVIKNNYASEGDFIGTDVSTATNIISSASPFKSVADKDFRLVSGSNLIDKGEIISGITDGFYGSKPDIGAYEYGLTPWVPGVNSLVGGEVDPTTGFDTQSMKETSIQIYPNPVLQTGVIVEMNADRNEKSISIFNNNGQLVFARKTKENSMVIPRSTFKYSGIYLVKVGTDKESLVEKLIVE